MAAAGGAAPAPEPAAAADPREAVAEVRPPFAVREAVGRALAVPGMTAVAGAATVPSSPALSGAALAAATCPPPLGLPAAVAHADRTAVLRTTPETSALREER
jgi:hypothetical protein